MTERTLDGFTLWNIEVPYRRPLSASRIPNQIKQAKVVFPPSQSSTQWSGSYIPLIDARDAKDGDLTKCPFYNIAYHDDREFFQCANLIASLRSRSLFGALEHSFSIRCLEASVELIHKNPDGRVHTTSLRERIELCSNPRLVWTDLQFGIQHASLLHPGDTSRVRQLAFLEQPLDKVDLNRQLQSDDMLVVLLRSKLDVSKIKTMAILAFVTPAAALFVLVILTLVISYLIGCLHHPLVTCITTDALAMSIFIGVGSLFFGVGCFFYDELREQTFTKQRWQEKGWTYSTLKCICGTPITTSHRTTVTERRMIWTLCDLMNAEFAKRRRMDNEKTTASETAQSSSRLGMETVSAESIESQEVVKTTATRNAARPSRDRAEPTDTSISENGSPTDPRYLYLSIPKAGGRDIVQLKLPDELCGDHDTAIIRKVVDAYDRINSARERLIKLRGVTDVQATRFELASIEKSLETSTETYILPLAMEWKWPTDGNDDWEWDKSNTDPSNQSINSMLMHLWTQRCYQRPMTPNDPGPSNRWWPNITICFGKQRETVTDILPRSVASMPGMEGIESIEMVIPDRSPMGGIPPTRNSITDKPDNSQDWVFNATLRVTHGCKPKYVHTRMPKKLRIPMEPDPNGIRGPIGWAIWVEEDFVVPWWLPLVFLIVALGAFVFAIAYTATHGPKANGWTISTGLLSIITFVFTAWVLWTKDSKHSR